MNKEIRSMEELVEWSEIANLGIPEPRDVFALPMDTFFELGNNIKENKQIKETLLFNLKNWYEQNLPDCPIPFRESYFYITVRPVNESRNKICFSPFPFFSEFLNNDYGFSTSKSSMMLFLNPRVFAENKSVEELKQIIKDSLRRKKDVLREYEASNKFFLVNETSEIKGNNFNKFLSNANQAELKEAVYKEIRQCNWLIKHLDEVFEFLSKEFPGEMFECIGKDKMLALLAFDSGHIVDLNKPLRSGLTHEMVISPTENYLLLVDYLESITGRKYHLNFSIPVETIENGVKSKTHVSNFTIEDMRKYLKEFYDEFPDTYTRSNRPTSYEEILRTKTVKTWNRIQQEKLINQIQLNWEFLPKSTNITTGEIAQLRTGKRLLREKDYNKLKKDYALLDKKLKFFESTEPLCTLSGINTFEGYQAYVYPNGTVALEKFYQRKGKDLYPATNSAIYIMNFSEFSELSKYSKPELIQEINDYNNKDIARVCHSGDWENRLKSIIFGSGYGVFDLEYIEFITRELSTKTVDKTKILIPEGTN